MEADLNNGGSKREIPLTGIGRIKSIAVDWIGNNIYIIDDAIKKIDVVNIDSGKQTNILGYLVTPMDIEVDPNSGYVSLWFVTF